MSRFAFASLSALLFSATAFRARQRRKGSTKTKQASGGKVVTLGDSYSSGTGIHRNGRDYEGGDCWRDLKTTPGAQYARYEGLEFVSKACKGDEIPGILGQWDEIQANNPADAASGWAGSTILFTIGGNDLRTHKGESWPGLLKSCIMSFYGKCHKKAENQIANFDELQATLTQLYTKIAQAAPKARIRVLGYPKLLQRKLLCVPVPGLALSAADWADQQVDELNRRLRLAVAASRNSTVPLSFAEEASGSQLLDKLRQKARAQSNGTTQSLDASLMQKGSRRRRSRRRATPAPTPAPTPGPGVDIEFVDVKRFFSRGACRVTKRDVHAIVLSGLSLSDSSFHPSQRGYNKYYDALGNSLGRTLPPLFNPPDVRNPDDLMNVFQGWDANGDGKLDMDESLAMADEAESPEVIEQMKVFFSQADKDQDGFLNLSEFEEFMTLVDDM